MLPRLPGAGWEGWFFIAVPRPGAAIRFAKWHLFRIGGGRFRHPIAAVEGLRGPAEIAAFVGTADRVLHRPVSLDPNTITADRERLAVSAPERIRLAGGDGAVTLEFHDPAASLSATLACRPGGRLAWAAWPPALSYLGFPGALSGTLTAFGSDHQLDGIAIAEHAWGGSLPFDPLRVAVPWQWDVLTFDHDGGTAVVAALSIEVPWLGPAVRVRGLLPGADPPRFARQQLDYLEVGDDPAAPRRWRGRLRGPSGELDYEAVASTPAAPAFAGGAFLGFDFVGTWRRGGQLRPLQGCGFAEHRVIDPGRRGRHFLRRRGRGAV